MASGFRLNVFDPVLIIAQIIALQCSYYLSMGLWITLADTLGGIQKSVDQLFDYTEFQGTYDGWMVMGAVALNAFSSAVALWWIVRRAKQSLDFAATVHIIHIILCFCYGGFPLSWAWWLTNLLSLVIMAVVGEWLCWRTELKAIPITGGTVGSSERGKR